MILLYADPREVRYVKYVNRFNVGIMAWRLEQLESYLKTVDEIVLFGSCGYTGNERIDYSKLIELKEFYPVHGHIDEEYRGSYYLTGVLYVDMETYPVYKFCKKHGIKFRSIRYVMDRCGRRCVPIGFNHWWRKYQHYRMQNKFNRWLDENYR